MRGTLSTYISLGCGTLIGKRDQQISLEQFDIGSVRYIVDLVATHSRSTVIVTGIVFSSFSSGSFPSSARRWHAHAVAISCTAAENRPRLLKYPPDGYGPDPQPLRPTLWTLHPSIHCPVSGRQLSIPHHWYHRHCCVLHLGPNLQHDPFLHHHRAQNQRYCPRHPKTRSCRRYGFQQH